MRSINPKNLYETMMPLSIVSWLCGINVIEYPRGHPRPYLSLIYATLIFMLYGNTVYLNTQKLHFIHTENVSNLSKFNYNIFFSGNNILLITITLLGWAHSKRLRSNIERLQAVDDSMEKIGIPKEYKRMFKLQLIQTAFLVVITAIIVYLSPFWILAENWSWMQKFTFLFTAYHPMAAMIVFDFNFADSIRYVRRRFYLMNELLQIISANNSFVGHDEKLQFMGKPTNLIPLEIRNASTHKKYRILRAIRQLHLELSKIARDMNDTQGIQLLLSMAVCFVIITGILYNMYAIIFREDAYGRNESVISEVISYSSWLYFYVVNVLMINFECARTSEEFTKAGEIIYNRRDIFLDLDTSIVKEVREFSLQLIQSPLTFTAAGFFVLNYTFVQEVIGYITTYLVILIQIDSLPKIDIVKNSTISNSTGL